MLRAPEGADPGELREARESLAPHAERQIKEEMVLDAIIDREELRPGDEEIEARIAELAERSGSAPGAVRRQLVKEGQLESLRRSIAVDRAFEFLKEQSEIADAQ
jgi:trigger factor